MLGGGRGGLGAAGVARKVVWATLYAEKNKCAFIRKTLSTQTNITESGKCEDKKKTNSVLV